VTDVTLEVRGGDYSASEPGIDKGTFKFYRSSSSNTSPEVMIYYTISGTASSADYQALTGSVKLNAGSTSTSFTVTPIGVFVGVRFNCPAVVRGEGRDLADQRRDIEALFEEYARTYDPPREPDRVRFFGRYELDWHDIVRLEDQLFAFLLNRNITVAQRLLACHRLIRRFASGAFESRKGGQVGIDPSGILAEVRRGESEPGELRAMERVMARLLAATFAGASLPSVRELSLLRRTGIRFSNVRQRLLMAMETGRVALPGLPEPVPVREVRRIDADALDAASAAMLERYFVAKIAGQTFFGRSFFRRAFATGLDFLVTSYGPILWLARAHALAGDNRRVGAADVEYGIRQVDYGLNYMPTLGGITERMRAALFWLWDTPEKLLGGR
jgi:hypothetical protein